MSDEKATLPEGGEWATGSLLDKSNVGKYVWASNGRGWEPTQIAKVGRTNVHVKRYGQTVSHLVHIDVRATAYGQFGATVQTDEYRSTASERDALVKALQDESRNYWQRVPLDKLRRIVAILDEDVTP